MKYKSRKRLLPSEIRKQLRMVAELRESGLSVAKACKKVGMPVPTYYFRIRGLAGPAIRRKPVILQKLAIKRVDGRTVAALRRSKSKHAVIAMRMREDLVLMRKLQRQLLRAAKTLG